MALFSLPPVRSLGSSLAWLPVRVAFSVLVRCPSALVRLPMSMLDQFVLVRRVAGGGGRRHGWLLRS